MDLLERAENREEFLSMEPEELDALCAEMRTFLVDSVSRTGGHLSSNLGAVELTVALHRVYDTSRDRLVFDVGHQCYTHKLLTGRRIHRIADIAPDFLGAGCAGCNHKLIRQTALPHHFFQYHLCHGRAANVAVANKHYFYHTFFPL